MTYWQFVGHMVHLIMIHITCISRSKYMYKYIRDCCLALVQTWISVIVYSVCLIVYYVCLIVYSVCLIVYSVCLIVYSVCLIVYSVCLIVYSVCLIVYSVCLIVYSVCLIVYSRVKASLTITTVAESFKASTYPVHVVLYLTSLWIQSGLC